MLAGGLRACSASWSVVFTGWPLTSITSPIVAPSSQPQSETAVSGAGRVAGEHTNWLPFVVVFTVLLRSTVTPSICRPFVKSLKNCVLLVAMSGPAPAARPASDDRRRRTHR